MDEEQILEGQEGQEGEPGEPGEDGGGAGGAGGKGGRGGTVATGVASKVGSSIIKYSYLFIVVAASITLLFLLRENRQIIKDIQDDRKRVALDICIDQNVRNDQLMFFLAEEDAKTKVEVKFVNLLAPKRNCEAYVNNIFDSVE